VGGGGWANSKGEWPRKEERRNRRGDLERSAATQETGIEKEVDLDRGPCERIEQKIWDWREKGKDHMHDEQMSLKMRDPRKRNAYRDDNTKLDYIGNEAEKKKKETSPWSRTQ